eukprot:TRINITY_DN21628_c0_g1_i1.p1 TRINITY_DN21628_c0_g1~~TRINITY_DN21628_c0_g1_i1.p1  ORF type:complete len:233 (-),score=58.05 TRINITY_DN21628_c0_g1_i1:83-745(-)
MAAHPPKSSLSGMSPESLLRFKLSDEPFLLIDIRETEIYSESHLPWKQVLHVPPGEVRPRRLHVSISDRLRQSPIETIIIMDESSGNAGENVNLRRLSQVLPSHKVFFLRRGFQGFTSAFPNEIYRKKEPEDLNRSFRVSPASSFYEINGSPAFHSGAISLSRESLHEPSSSVSMLNDCMIEEDEQQRSSPESGLLLVQSIKDRLRTEVRKKMKGKKVAY